MIEIREDSVTRRHAPGFSSVWTRVQAGLLGDCKSVGGGVLELRVDYGPGYRVYLGRHGNELVLLLIGGDKRTQQRDIEHAQGYWQDWKHRETR